jgi:hypothetical protein
MGNAVDLLLDTTRIVLMKRNPREVDYCREKGEKYRREKEKVCPEQNSGIEWVSSREFPGKLTT